MRRYLIPTTHRRGELGVKQTGCSLIIKLFIISRNQDLTVLCPGVAWLRGRPSEGPIAPLDSSPRNDNRRLKKRVSAAKYDSAARYPVSRRFRQPADPRVTARWPAGAGNFGLGASEGQFHRCPVPIRSLSQIRQSKHPTAPVPPVPACRGACRGAGLFMCPTLLPRVLESSAHNFSQIPVSNFRSHLCPKIKSATPSPIRK